MRLPVMDARWASPVPVMGVTYSGDLVRVRVRVRVRVQVRVRVGVGVRLRVRVRRPDHLVERLV